MKKVKWCAYDKQDNKWRFIVKYLILLSLFVMGCVATHKLTSKSYPAKSENCKIDIFMTKKPTKNFEEIAIIIGSLNRIKKQVCLLGGDGIVFQTVGGGQIAGAGVRYIVIKYIE